MKLKSLTLTVLRIYIISMSLPSNVARTSPSNNDCYQPLVLKLQWTDSCPVYCLNLTFTKEGTLAFYIRVFEVVQVPIAHFALSQIDPNGKRFTFFNISARLCDIKNAAGKIPMLRASLTAVKGNNFKCPVTIGNRTLVNMRLHQRNPFLALMYRQKNHFTVSGGISKELPDKSRIRLTAFNVTAKIVKRRCDLSGDLIQN